MLIKRWMRLLMLLVLAGTLFTLVPEALAQESELPPICQIQALADPEEIRLFCVPPAWNGILVVYAHGYVSPYEPLALPLDELGQVNGLALIEGILAEGFAFATTSYTKNGYAVEAADGDLDRLVGDFEEKYGDATVLLIGASEGGLITAQQIERDWKLYDGGLALCGPVAGLPYQIQYLGDFRVIFDHFFPTIFGFDAVNVDPDAHQAWETGYTPAIVQAMTANPDKVSQLFQVTRAAQDWRDLATSRVQTTLQALYYNIFGMNDFIQTAGGNPYGNAGVWYWGLGPLGDWELNQSIDRYTADGRAVAYGRKYYETTGRVKNPLITMHTLQDPAVPFSHELIYGYRVNQAGSAVNVTILPVPGYGHCTFEPWQVLAAFNLLVNQTTGQTVSGMDHYTLPRSLELNSIQP